MNPVVELQEYWDVNGLSHLPLKIVALDTVKGDIDPQQYAMVKEGWPGTVVARAELDESTFNKLVFIKHNEGKTNPIIAGNRSLSGIVTTISQRYPNLDELFNLNDWFQDVRAIYESFDYGKFGHLVLRAPTYSNERDESDGGSLYLEGGNHRALALAIKTNLEGYAFKPVKAVILLQPLAKRG